MLLKPAANDYSGRHPKANDVFLLIEASDSTREPQYAGHANTRISREGENIALIHIPDAVIEAAALSRR